MPEHPVHEFRPGTLTPHGCERCGKVKADPVHRQGGDGKYGRLFTEADVKAMLYEMEEAGMLSDRVDVEEAFRLNMVGRLTFPADEPLFLLRGQDIAAPATISAYAVESARAGSSREHGEQVGDAFRRVNGWQLANPDRVKVAD